MTEPGVHRLHWRTALLPFLALLAWLLVTSGWRPLMDPDEGRYVGVAWSMLQSGDWWVPRLNGLPFFHKPPLFYWIGAGAMAVFGPHEWAARLPSTLGALLSAGALLLFLRRWYPPASDERLPALATTVLVTMPFFFVGAQFANLDMLVAGCITGAILAGAWAALAQAQGLHWRWPLLVTYGLVAAGLLAKGLIGAVLPAAVLGLWCLLSHRRSAVRLALWWPGWLLLLVLCAPWFVAMQLRFPEFFDYFFVTQHFRRFTSSGFNNEHPFWFYLPVLATLTLPWFPWLLAWRQRQAGGTGDLDRLMLVWLAVVLGFFSIPRAKLVGYILPALPPLAFLITRCVLAGRGERAWPRSASTATVLGAALCVLGVIAVLSFEQRPDRQLPSWRPSALGEADRVVMLHDYYYELPFYWRLRAPVAVLHAWQAPDAAWKDNWRREMLDAARFEPQRAAQTLIDAQRLAAILCRNGTTWLIGPQAAAIAHPWLAGAQLMASNPRASVWRMDGPRLVEAGCASLRPGPSAPAP